MSIIFEQGRIILSSGLMNENKKKILDKKYKKIKNQRFDIEQYVHW